MRFESLEPLVRSIRLDLLGMGPHKRLFALAFRFCLARCKFCQLLTYLPELLRELSVRFDKLLVFVLQSPFVVLCFGKGRARKRQFLSHCLFGRLSCSRFCFCARLFLLKGLVEGFEIFKSLSINPTRAFKLLQSLLCKGKLSFKANVILFDGCFLCFPLLSFLMCGFFHGPELAFQDFYQFGVIRVILKFRCESLVLFFHFLRVCIDEFIRAGLDKPNTIVNARGSSLCFTQALFQL
mmetsp:Transcript_10008/g.17557  ORF Transcript_10008/g.17557 Transcript_10008/m.17557 type:complete len:238 (-) Transcript_10008:798-1511(-)